MMKVWQGDLWNGRKSKELWINSIFYLFYLFLFVGGTTKHVTLCLEVGTWEGTSLNLLFIDFFFGEMLYGLYIYAMLSLQNIRICAILSL